MAWTAPMTFVANSVLTAAQLNTHLTANLMECPAAKATSQGSYFVSDGVNSIVERFSQTTRVSTYQATTSTSFANLATVGPTVTVTTGTTAIVFIYCMAIASVTNTMGSMSWEISGATTRAAIDATAGRIDGITAGNQVSLNSVDIVTDLTPGSNTFTAKYKTGGSSYQFGDRFIGVLPL